MKISLILCSVGRTNDLVNFLESLCEQKYKRFEVILVDQNEDNRLDDIVGNFNQKLLINHIRTSRGLSKARNYGLKYVTGDVVAFPDDDCIYTPNLLYDVVEFMNNDTSVDVLSIKLKNSIPNGRVMQNKAVDCLVNKKNIFKLVCSISLFFRSYVTKNIGDFDEKLGLGTNTIFVGSEDYDFPLRAIERGYKIYFSSKIEVLHPWDDITIENSKNLLERSYGGGAAEMYVLNKHRYTSGFKVKRVIRRGAIIIYCILKGRADKTERSIHVMKGMIDYFNTKEYKV